jgi:hypothetical protein
MAGIYKRFILILFAAYGIARADKSEEILAVAGRFTPAKEGVELTYQISYHVLGLKLMRIGEARSFVVEGEWINDEGDKVPAFYSEVSFDTRDDPDSDDRGRISIHNKMVAVMSNPDLKTMVYYKIADEYLNPFFKSPTHEYYLDYYAVKDGGIDYFREDHHSGERDTELKNAGELVKQSNAVAETLRRMSGIYNGRESRLTHDSDFRVYFNVAGEVKPFAAVSSKETFRVTPIDRKLESLRVDISLAPEAEGKGGSLTLWGVPFSELAAHTERAELIRLAEDSPDWSMVPLQMNYKRPIGYIRCHLETIQGRDFEKPARIARITADQADDS